MKHYRTYFFRENFFSKSLQNSIWRAVCETTTSGTWNGKSTWVTTTPMHICEGLFNSDDFAMPSTSQKRYLMQPRGKSLLDLADELTGLIHRSLSDCWKKLKDSWQCADNPVTSVFKRRSCRCEFWDRASDFKIIINGCWSQWRKLLKKLGWSVAGANGRALKDCSTTQSCE